MPISPTSPSLTESLLQAGIDNGVCLATVEAITAIVPVTPTVVTPAMPAPVVTPAPVKAPVVVPVKAPVKVVEPVKVVPVKAPVKAKSAPIVTTESTSTEKKTPTSTVKTATSTTVVIDNPEHIKPGTFVATSKSTAKATVVETKCAPTCAADFKKCAGTGMSTTSTCCGTGFVCMMKNDNYAQCLPTATAHVYMSDDWAKTPMTCKY